MRLSGIASLLIVLGLPCACRADETLTLNLPSPRAQEASSASSAKNSASSGAKKKSPTPNRHASMRGAPPEQVIGRLGITRRSASIRTGPNRRKRALATIAKGTYLALTHVSGDWYGVLMIDRSTGWIRNADVELLNYEVVADPSRQQYADSSAYTGSALLSSGQKSLLEVAFTYLGVPYKYGGTAPNGMDCSAFVQRCFAALGIRLPRTAREQSACGTPVTPEQLQPADRLYFASRSGRINHTGIYIGNDLFIHASSSRGGVAVSRLSEPMYRRMFVGARR